MMKHILTVLASMAFVLPTIAADAQVPYPEGYRDWHHVKSMVIDNGHPLYEAFGGIHHLYANPQAVAGYKAGKFPDGAIIVFDLLEANSADHAVTEAVLQAAGVAFTALRNGFYVTGESACASPENFDAELGRKIARENARSKIWTV